MKAPSSHRGSLPSILVTPVHRGSEETILRKHLRVSSARSPIGGGWKFAASNFPERRTNRIGFGWKGTLRLVVGRGQDRGPVRPEDCAMEVGKPAAGALRSEQRRLVELSTAEDKVEEGACTDIGVSWPVSVSALA
ncbi:hypothetical protein WN51_07155 [Melipona quadrifasciata]|uniref:Uncharacterized protein n=1 Tax=Melipona quadrifasciata TaxID=166423 RepID=A0A0M9AA98_9HYME|nr:hypothetical protein WN51_07155 [Melipona quadrifasciata]